MQQPEIINLTQYGDFKVGEKAVVITNLLSPKNIDFPYMIPKKGMCLTIDAIHSLGTPNSLKRVIKISFKETFVNRDMDKGDSGVWFSIHYFEPYCIQTEEEKKNYDLYYFQLN